MGGSGEHVADEGVDWSLSNEANKEELNDGLW